MRASRSRSLDGQVHFAAISISPQNAETAGASNFASALITKLTASNVLDGLDIQALQQLPIKKSRLAAQEAIVADGSRPQDCCIVEEGFAFRAKVTADGHRQVLSLHIPGEIPDLQSLHLNILTMSFEH